MNSLERVRACLAREETDRAPRLLYGEAIGYVPAIRKMLEDRCRPNDPRAHFSMDITRVEPEATRLDRDRFARWHGDDFRAANERGEIDEWGVRWQHGNFFHYAHIVSPLRNADGLDELETFPWPDWDLHGRYVNMAGQVRALHEEGLAVCAFAGSVFEQAWYLRGMEPLMMDMLADPASAHFLLERTAAIQKAAAIRMAKAGVDIVILGDDVAGQNGLLLSHELWRTFLRDRLATTCSAVHETSPSAKVFYHSDGNVVPLIPDLIECGVDILNPLQPECLDPAAVKRDFGDRLSFWGAVSVQRTMSTGTPEEVRAEVHERLRTVGRDGGYILAPAHVLGPETPWENIQAFFDAADEFAEYAR